MGAKRPSTRTLESGEKVTHYPDGRQVLQQGSQTKLHERLDEMRPTHQWLDAEKVYGLVQEVEKKKAAMDEGDAIPNDKRPL